MKATVVGLVSPHVLRVIDLANEAEKGVNVDWHVRDTVTKSMDALGDQFNAQDLVETYLQGLDRAAGQVNERPAYVRTLRSAAEIARRLRRD